MSRIDMSETRSRLRISEPKRAISSECAPRSWKKLSSIDTRSIFITSPSARTSASCVGVFGATKVPLPTAMRGPLGGGRFLRSALWLIVIGMRQPLEIGRHHVGRQALAQLLGDLAMRRVLRALLDRVVGDELGRARLGLVDVDHGLRDVRHLLEHELDLGQLDAIAAELDLRVDAAEEFDLVVVVDAAEVAGAVDALRRDCSGGPGSPG